MHAFRQFVRTEQRCAVAGLQAIYTQQVDYAPHPTVVADARGVHVSGPFSAVRSKEEMIVFHAVLEAAWSDHCIIKLGEGGRLTDVQVRVTMAENKVAMDGWR